MALFAITAELLWHQVSGQYALCQDRLLMMANITPGKVPDEQKRFGLAQMIPNEALTSLVAITFTCNQQVISLKAYCRVDGSSAALRFNSCQPSGIASPAKPFSRLRLS